MYLFLLTIPTMSVMYLCLLTRFLHCLSFVPANQIPTLSFICLSNQIPTLSVICAPANQILTLSVMHLCLLTRIHCLLKRSTFCISHDMPSKEHFLCPIELTSKGVHSISHAFKRSIFHVPWKVLIKEHFSISHGAYTSTIKGGFSTSHGAYIKRSTVYFP